MFTEKEQKSMNDRYKAEGLLLMLLGIGSIIGIGFLLGAEIHELWMGVIDTFSMIP